MTETRIFSDTKTSRKRNNFKVEVVDNDYIREHWDELTQLIAESFKDSNFSEGFYLERPAEHTLEEMEKDLRLKHLIATGEKENILGALFCVPIERAENAKFCDIGWFISLPGFDQALIMNTIATKAHEELTNSGYEAIITEMGTESGSEFLSMRHGYIPAPTKQQKNRWIALLNRSNPEKINDKSKKQAWSKDAKQVSRIATQNIKKDEIILDWKLVLVRVKEASKNTLQLGENLHYQPKPLLALNHSCEPNTYTSFEDLTLRANREIKKGEELNFHYCTTEYEIAETFQCHCGSKFCLKYLQGFKYLSKEEKQSIPTPISPYIKSLGE